MADPAWVPVIINRRGVDTPNPSKDNSDNKDVQQYFSLIVFVHDDWRNFAGLYDNPSSPGKGYDPVLRRKQVYELFLSARTDPRQSSAKCCLLQVPRC